MGSLKYVILNDTNKVTNIILADSVEHAEELTGAIAVAVDESVKVSQGDDYDGVTFSNAQREAHLLAVAEAKAADEAAKAAEASE
jgi:hypothetical protein